MDSVKEDHALKDAIDRYKDEALPMYNNQSHRVEEALKLPEDRLKELDTAINNHPVDYLMTVKRDTLFGQGSVIEEDQNLPGNFRLRPSNTYATPTIPLPNLLLGISRYSRTTVDGEDVLVSVPMFNGELFGKLIENDLGGKIDLVVDRKMFVKMVDAVKKILWSKPAYEKLRVVEKVIGNDVDADYWSEVRVWKNTHHVFGINEPLRKQTHCFVAQFNG